ncbi:MnhB domain-containing protein [Pseudohaliea rubra]|uniref:Na+/H+ antiporter MnhB subunit-related protein n=1 Tax=Pseudohaliea rubra DSM 19751 TaxID=1265313 RepID=A0A095VNN2_9GAMM|nr:MnhB domain-containing protein [Pseudohaliea rubra]KGE02985.1 Na+/H+ antiporter MnhB subunit-related protein [Pseudohaliea rubra DSM 19751]
MIHAHDSVIVRTLGRILIPVAQLYGCYVIVFGQYGPGGGFVGGVVLAASMILAILIFGQDADDSWLARVALHGDGLGLLIFAGVGGLCLIGGGQFLNYAHLQVPGLDEPARRSLGILATQIGVALDVAVTGISISISLSSEDEDEDEDDSDGEVSHA